MKVLRIYDHLGELKKEFNVFVEGENFKWKAFEPQVIWLGTISLEELGEVPVAERTPEAEVLTPEEEKPELSRNDFMKLPMEKRRELLGKQVEEVKRESEPVKCSLCSWEGKQRDCCFGHDSFVCPKCFHESIEDVMEVKDEPKEVHRKRSRDKRTKTSSNAKSTEVVSPTDSPGDTHKRNKGSGMG